LPLDLTPPRPLIASASSPDGRRLGTGFAAQAPMKEGPVVQSLLVKGPSIWQKVKS
jgi:hypothetical protein